jgi:tetratricopeptide (TPR) repeat protein
VRFAEIEKSEEALQRKFARDVAILTRHTIEHPDDPRWWFYLGESLQNLERYEEAIAAFQRCWLLDGWDEESAWAMYRCAQCWLALEEPVRAVAASAAGLARHAGVADLAWQAGYAAYQAGRHEQAIYWAELAIVWGFFRGCGSEVPRIGFRHLPALWEGPYDILRFARRALGDETGAAEAERLYEEALAAREASASS